MSQSESDKQETISELDKLNAEAAGSGNDDTATAAELAAKEGIGEKIEDPDADISELEGLQ